MALQINVGAKRDGTAEQPTESHAKNSAEKAHNTGFHKEKSLHIRISRAQSLQNADFAASFENRHHQRVHDAERGDRQSQAAEDSQK